MHIKNALRLACFIGAAALPASAAPPVSTAPLEQERDIRSIRRHYRIIEGALGRYVKVTRAVMGRSSEGGELEAYFAGKSPRKITVRLYGGQYQTHSSFYFWEDRLIFVNRVTRRYLSMETANKFTREEDRFYFANGNLVRSVEQSPQGDTKTAREFEKRLLAEAREWLKMAHETAGKR